MAWKKKWPSETKAKLKASGLSDSDIKILENFGSLDKFFKDPAGEMHVAKKALLQSVLKEQGLM